MRKIRIDFIYENNRDETITVMISNNLDVEQVLEQYREDLQERLEKGEWDATDIEFYQMRLQADERIEVIPDNTKVIEFNY